MIEDRLRFLEIDNEVIAELQSAKQLIEPELDRMLGEFYTHLMNEPEVKRIFADDMAIENARTAQKAHWLQTLFGGKFKSAYFDAAERIGRSHARVGLTPNWYIGGYSKMLGQFVRHVAVAAPEQNRDATPVIEALCKAVLLDIDLVIHCYLAAKDETMLDVLERATTFTTDMEELNRELSLAMAEARKSIDAMCDDASEPGRGTSQPATLNVQIDAIADKVKQIDERISKLKTDDRLYLHGSSDRTGILAKLKALISGE
jgi:methyl-accepting chemotaxis protein